MACINPNSPEFKAALERTGGNPLLAEINVDGVNYTLKATSLLQSPKADQFFTSVTKNKISGDSFWKKMQADLGIPKDQLEILKSFNTQDRGELISSLLANYSYAVEINLAKEKKMASNRELSTFEYNGYEYSKIGTVYQKRNLNTRKIEDSDQEEYLTAIKNSSTSEVPTQIYSNLTVPGGTNYTENEIATPAIKPSIKGHAEFSTDNGIGWFRSDEVKDYKGELFLLNNYFYQTDGIKYNIEPEDSEGGMSKSISKEEYENARQNQEVQFINKRDIKSIRRILEVQSDLFQKGRDKSTLIFDQNTKFEKSSKEEFEKAKQFGQKENVGESGVIAYTYNDNVYIYDPEEEKYSKRMDVERKNEKQNQFLQLLNQGSNWVTFFVKSIIQDSSKKGYEKVLFPSGDTASKVEGHTTLEEFKKQKEYRIKEIDEKINTVSKNYLGFWSIPNDYNANGTIKQFNTKEEAIKELNREKNQLKQELERVEGPEGFGALKPIYNFYENTVKNVLNKQYGKENVKQVTDEYGNTWNEVEIISEREQQPVLLQKEGTETSVASPKTIALVKDFLKRIGVDVKGVKNIVVNGVRMDANAAAQVTQKLIQVAEGKEATALPEEAMHFAVEIIKQTNPKLYNQLLKEINNYNILKQVFADYSGNKNYQTKDGKPDVLKLKEEAIGKVLAETIIRQSEGSTEKPELLAKAQSWWRDIIDWIKSLIAKSGFDKIAIDILSGKEIGTAEDIRAEEGRIFLQNTKQDQIYNKFKDIARRIEKKTVKTDGGEMERYFIDGKEIKLRVSDLTKTFFERMREERALTDTEFQIAINTMKADKGTAGHKDFEYAFSLFVDENGYLKSDADIEEAIKNDGHTSFINPNDNKMYEMLRDNLLARVKSFPTGTRFMSEATIFDPKRSIAGTVDFMAITPEGKISVLDWKFMALDIDKYSDVPWYNVQSWNKQMDQYKLIIKSAYGVENQNFEQTRMIPIHALYSKPNYKEEIAPVLLSIKIGDVNVKNIKEDYLLPVGIQTEKTGDKRLDKLLEKLNAVYKRIAEQKVLPNEKISKNEQLNELFKAIRHLQMKKDVGQLLYQAKVFNKQVRDILNTFDVKFKGKDAKSFTEDEVNDFTGRMRNAIETLDVYKNLDTELEFLFETEMTEDDKKLRDDIRDTVGNIRGIAARLEDADESFTNDIIAGREEMDVISPEKIVRGITKWFGNTATIQIKSLQTLFKKANRAFTFAAMDTVTETKKLQEIKNKFDEWARGKGYNIKNYFDILKKKDKNELIDEYDSEFYKTLKSKIQSKDSQWVRDNIDVAKYNEYLKAKKEEEYTRIENKPENILLPDTEENIEANNQTMARMRIEKEKVDRLYDTSTTESLGWLIYDDVKKFPASKWESKEWKELNAKGNEPAKAFYDYIKERNEYYKSIGYLQKGDAARTFLPWVRKGLAEKLIFGGKTSLGEQFLRNISVDEGDVGYGQRDPITGEVIDKVPIYFTREIEGEVSTDLFRTMALYNEMAIKFKYLSDIEEQGRALIRLERNKKAISTSWFGKTEYKDGELQYSPDNSENSKILEDMVKAIVYQQKFIQSETFDQMLGKLGTFGEKLNKKLGFKLLPENLSGRQVSINKVINQLNTTFQLNALGLNSLSALSNLFGGTFQSIINSGKYFTKTEFNSTMLWLTSGKMTGLMDKKKAIAAIDYFLPFIENYNKDLAKKLSLSKLSQENIQEFLMILMRNSDKAVQTTNFFSYLRNTIVQDGKVMNAREYMRTTDEYKDMYAGTEEQRKDRMDKFEEDVKKIIDEKGLMKVAEIVDGEFTIPGVDKKSESVVELRTRIQSLTSDALGSLSEANKRLINLNIYGNSFMVFKNWIPRLVDVRIGNLKYNAASDAYEWGRMRMLYRTISEDLGKGLSLLKGSITGLSDNNVDFVRELYEKKKADYEKDTGKTLDMTESQFIDLVRQNIKNQMLDVMIFASLMALYLGLKANPPEDDEDPRVKNQYKFLLKMTDKFTDEIAYFYDPTNMTKLVSGGIFPAIGLIDNYRKVLANFGKEMYGLGVGDEELVKKTQVIKYVMRSFPISSQAAGILPMFYPNLAKDLGIKMPSQYGIR